MKICFFLIWIGLILSRLILGVVADPVVPIYSVASHAEYQDINTIPKEKSTEDLRTEFNAPHKRYSTESPEFLSQSRSELQSEPLSESESADNPPQLAFKDLRTSTKDEYKELQVASQSEYNEPQDAESPSESDLHTENQELQLVTKEADRKVESDPQSENKEMQVGLQREYSEPNGESPKGEPQLEDQEQLNATKYADSELVPESQNENKELQAESQSEYKEPQDESPEKSEPLQDGSQAEYNDLQTVTNDVDSEPDPEPQSASKGLQSEAQIEYVESHAESLNESEPPKDEAQAKTKDLHTVIKDVDNEQEPESQSDSEGLPAGPQREYTTVHIVNQSSVPAEASYGLVPKGFEPQSQDKHLQPLFGDVATKYHEPGIKTTYTNARYKEPQVGVQPRQHQYTEPRVSGPEPKNVEPKLSPIYPENKTLQKGLQGNPGVNRKRLHLKDPYRSYVHSDISYTASSMRDPLPPSTHTLSHSSYKAPMTASLFPPEPDPFISSRYESERYPHYGRQSYSEHQDYDNQSPLTQFWIMSEQCTHEFQLRRCLTSCSSVQNFFAKERINLCVDWFIHSVCTSGYEGAPKCRRAASFQAQRILTSILDQIERRIVKGKSIQSDAWASLAIQFGWLSTKIKADCIANALSYYVNRFEMFEAEIECANNCYRETIIEADSILAMAPDESCCESSSTHNETYRQNSAEVAHTFHFDFDIKMQIASVVICPVSFLPMNALYPLLGIYGIPEELTHFHLPNDDSYMGSVAEKVVTDPLTTTIDIEKRCSNFLYGTKQLYMLTRGKLQLPNFCMSIDGYSIDFFESGNIKSFHFKSTGRSIGRYRCYNAYWHQLKGCTTYTSEWRMHTSCCKSFATILSERKQVYPNEMPSMSSSQMKQTQGGAGAASQYPTPETKDESPQFTDLQYEKLVFKKTVSSRGNIVPETAPAKPQWDEFDVASIEKFLDNIRYASRGEKLSRVFQEENFANSMQRLFSGKDTLTAQDRRDGQARHHEDVLVSRNKVATRNVRGLGDTRFDFSSHANIIPQLPAAPSSIFDSRAPLGSEFSSTKHLLLKNRNCFEMHKVVADFVMCFEEFHHRSKPMPSRLYSYHEHQHNPYVENQHVVRRALLPELFGFHNIGPFIASSFTAGFMITAFAVGLRLHA